MIAAVSPHIEFGFALDSFHVNRAGKPVWKKAQEIMEAEGRHCSSRRTRTSDRA